MASVDVVAKFTYLTHGQKAPRGSSFKGIISTESIIGFREYTKREQSKVLSNEAQHAMDERHGFFGYTSTRVGATKTYTSDGWIRSKEQDFTFREKIAAAFHEDGHLLWTPVLSLENFDVSFDQKLFNEEDYANILDKILPKWFASAGFQKDNMIWWMDHHVNTDNPHLHFSFLEQEKQTHVGKLSMKDMERFKTLFWNEVFARKEFLAQVGKDATDVFKEKDLMKKDLVSTFSDSLKHLTDDEITKMLKDLFSKLPESGRLQYGSVPMIEHREELDAIVEAILQQKDTFGKYQEFIQTLKQFDEVKNQHLHTESSNMVRSEDRKLRKQLANMILKDYKELMNQVKTEATKSEQDDLIYLPIAGTIRTKLDNDTSRIHIPGTSYTLIIDDENIIPCKGRDNFYMAILPKNFKQEVTKNDTTLQLSKDNIFDYFSNGESYIFPKSNVATKDTTFTKEKEYIQMLKQKELAKTKQNSVLPSTHSHAKKASWSWMKKVQREAEQAQEEYLRGKENVYI